MEIGTLYVMTTIVPGLVKIGKSPTCLFTLHINSLEQNGYSNVVGLKCRYAIEVDNFNEKEALLKKIFSASRVNETDLYALDINVVEQLLSSFKGNQVYPPAKTPKGIHQEKPAATTTFHPGRITEKTVKTTISRPGSTSEKKTLPEITPAKKTLCVIPNGTYYIFRYMKNIESEIKATMDVIDGKFIIRKGTVANPIDGFGLSRGLSEKRRKNITKSGVVMNDISFKSPSSAGSFVTGAEVNGWIEWRISNDPQSDVIDIFRN